MSSVIWKTVKIKDIAKINPDSISPKTPKDTLINYIDLESVKKGKILAIKEMKLGDAPSRAKRVVKNGDVLFSTVRPYQKNFTIIENEQDNLIASTGFAILRAKENSDSRFIYQMLYSDVFMNQIISEMKGSNYPAVNASDVEKVEILLPSLEEQQKIASILSTVDEQIDETEQLIVKTKELKKGLMQQLLTKGIGHTEFKKTVLGEIPVEWSLKSFAEITDVLKCGVASTPKYTEEGVIFLSSQNVKENKIILDKYNFISKDYHEELTKKVKPQNGDILYTRVGANFGKAAVVDLDFEFSVYVSLTLIRLKEGYDEHFYMQLLNSDMYQKIAKNTVFQGGGVPNLNVKEVEKFLMLIPPLEEQQRIASILSTVDSQIESYEEEKAKYEELKKGLMQQLLTGQIRVKI